MVPVLCQSSGHVTTNEIFEESCPASYDRFIHCNDWRLSALLQRSLSGKMLNDQVQLEWLSLLSWDALGQNISALLDFRYICLHRWMHADIYPRWKPLVSAMRPSDHMQSQFTFVIIRDGDIATKLLAVRASLPTWSSESAAPGTLRDSIAG